MSVPLSILIPAHDEEAYIGACLDALLASDSPPDAVEVLVMANGCTDATVSIAEARAEAFAQKGWPFRVLDLPQGGKLGALNAGDAAARHPARAYLDADVTVSPGLVAALTRALDVAEPRYVSGTALIAPPQTRVTRAYARFWQTLPFVTDGVPGFGLFAVNGPGRARWGDYPDIISDDTFVRLNFTPAERIKLPQTYTWPMIEGFPALVKVRRRQNLGVAEVAARYPALWQNNDPAPEDTPPVWQRFLRDPVGFSVYGAVALATKLPQRGAERWARGR